MHSETTVISVKDKIKVYICPIEEPYFKFIKAINMSPHDCGSEMIKRWEEALTLPQEALDFLNLCEEHGSVYTLTEFQTAINRDYYLNLKDSYVFFTDKY